MLSLFINIQKYKNLHSILPKFTIFILQKVPKFAVFKAYYTKQHNLPQTFHLNAFI